MRGRENLSKKKLPLQPFNFALARHSQVSWIRHRDWHILSAGPQVFTKDARFHLIHSAEDREWTLLIKYLKREDQGTYVCQVSQTRDVTDGYDDSQPILSLDFWWTANCLSRGGSRTC